MISKIQNNPSVGSIANNATSQQIQFLVTGLESRHRGYVTNISQAWNTFGREVWYLNASDSSLSNRLARPKWKSFQIALISGLETQVVAHGHHLTKRSNKRMYFNWRRQHCQSLPMPKKVLLLDLPKTIQGYQLWLPANFVYQNGIRMDGRRST